MIFVRFAAVCSLVVAVACGSGSTSPPSAGATCDEIQASAREELTKVFTSHAACTTDVDCISTSFAAQCFDSCAAAINKDGSGELAAAKERVNGAQCSRFTAQGCKLVIPPCVPPQAPSCNAGHCQ